MSFGSVLPLHLPPQVPHLSDQVKHTPVERPQLARNRLERLDLLPALALLYSRLSDAVGPDALTVILGVSRQDGGHQGREGSEARPSPPGSPQDGRSGPSGAE